MLPSINMTVGLQVAAVNPKSNPPDPEQYAATHGRLVVLPSLRDRIFLHAGKFFINAGKKLTSVSLEHMSLTEEGA
jgi:hypothetical protein